MSVDPVTPVQPTEVVELPVTVTVSIEIKPGTDAITRVTGPGGDDWRRSFTNARTRDDVLEHWAIAAVDGAHDAHDLDGWADLAPGTVTFHLISAYRA